MIKRLLIVAMTMMLLLPSLSVAGALPSENDPKFQKLKNITGVGMVIAAPSCPFSQTVADQITAAGFDPANFLCYAVAGGSSILLTGVTATGSVGTLTVQADAVVSLTGISGTGALGNLLMSTGEVAVLTGISGSGSVGTLVVSADAVVALTGVTASGSLGNITVSGGAGSPYYFGYQTSKSAPAGGSLSTYPSAVWVRDKNTTHSSVAAGTITEICAYAATGTGYCLDPLCVEEGSCVDEFGCNSTWTGGAGSNVRVGVYNTDNTLNCQWNSYLSGVQSAGWLCSTTLSGTCTVAASTAYKLVWAQAGQEAIYQKSNTGAMSYGATDYTGGFPGTLTDGTTGDVEYAIIIKVQP